MGPLAHTDGHYDPGLIDEVIPGTAALRISLKCVLYALIVILCYYYISAPPLGEQQFGGHALTALSRPDSG